MVLENAATMKRLLIWQFPNHAEAAGLLEASSAAPVSGYSWKPEVELYLQPSQQFCEFSLSFMKPLPGQTNLSGSYYLKLTTPSPLNIWM